MPDHVQFLVVFGPFERRQSRGNCIVRPWLDFDVVRWVGVYQVDRRPVQKPIHVLGLGRIRTKKSVVTQDPKVARLGGCLVGRLGNIVGVGQARGAIAQESHELFARKTSEVHVEVELLQLYELAVSFSWSQSDSFAVWLSAMR